MLMLSGQSKIAQRLSLCLIAVTMVVSCTQKKQENQSNESLDRDALAKLVEGNKRFASNHPIHPDQTLEKLRELEKGQHPFAVVVSCSDSRVPPELIFDQGLGDLFIIRNAGNIVGDYEIGSVEYAVEHLKVNLVIVLGHTNCGAIRAYLDHPKDTIPNHIQSIVDYIKKEPEEIAINKKGANYYEESIKANVLHGVHILSQSKPVLKEFIEKGELKIVGANYDIHTGKVSFISE
ncbi:MAG: hypothetical protein RI983_1558 [Bacteroidota bacterium]|jgi:carbonic anhydrase